MAEAPPENLQDDKHERQILGDRMKKYEALHMNFLDASQPFVVRLDGKNFSKLTMGLNKPFDTQFAIVLNNVCKDLIESEFNPSTIYTQSDEISVLFYPTFNPKTQKYQEYIFSGRVEKIITVMAGFTTARFNYHLLHEKWDEYSENVRKKILCGKACFDARILSFPISGDTTVKLSTGVDGYIVEVPFGDMEMANHIVWRCGHDCVRNTTLNYAINKFGQPMVHGWDTRKMREELEQIGLPWSNIPDRAKYGAFFKKSDVPTTVTVSSGPEVGCKKIVNKTKVCMFYMLFNKSTPNNIELLKSKLLNTSLVTSDTTIYYF